MKSLCRFCFNALIVAAKWICNTGIIVLYEAAVLITVPVSFLIAIMISLFDWSAPSNKKSLVTILVRNLKYGVEYYHSIMNYKQWHRS